jgi:hypothetical protein
MCRVAPLLAAVLLAAGCESYQRKPLPFRMPSDYPNAKEVEGVQLGAAVLRDRGEAKQIFGFDIIKAGVLPVQVVIADNGNQAVVIDPTQTFLVESGGRVWPVLAQEVAAERISKETGWGELGPGAGKGALLGTAVGALGGLAIGILTRAHTGEAVLGGAVVGAAGGAVIGGAKGLSEHGEVEHKILRDLRDRSMDNRQVHRGEIGHGVIFFGTEAQGASMLKLRIKAVETGAAYTVDMLL